MKVGWSTSHLEFTIEDDYYFSKLRKYCKKKGIKIDEVGSFNKLGNYDVIVFNYPEKRFAGNETRKIMNWVTEGKRIIFTGYYRNEDKVNENLNRVLRIFGIHLRKDAVVDKAYEDIYFPRAKVFGIKSIDQVVMPCSASMVLKKGVSPFIIGNSTTFSIPGNEKEPVIGARKQIGSGEIIAIGTCVFWDNFSIDKQDNVKLALNLLSHKTLNKMKTKKYNR
jgi:hypothetical protein